MCNNNVHHSNASRTCNRRASLQRTNQHGSLTIAQHQYIQGLTGTSRRGTYWDSQSRNSGVK